MSMTIQIQMQMPMLIETLKKHNNINISDIYKKNKKQIEIGFNPPFIKE